MQSGTPSKNKKVGMEGQLACLPPNGKAAQLISAAIQKLEQEALKQAELDEQSPTEENTNPPQASSSYTAVTDILDNSPSQEHPFMQYFGGSIKEASLSAEEKALILYNKRHDGKFKTALTEYLISHRNNSYFLDIAQASFSAAVTIFKSLNLMSFLSRQDIAAILYKHEGEFADLAKEEIKKSGEDFFKAFNNLVASFLYPSRLSFKELCQHSCARSILKKGKYFGSLFEQEKISAYEEKKLNVEALNTDQDLPGQKHCESNSDFNNDSPQPQL